MGRPPVPENKKKIPISVSLKKSSIDLIEKTDNASHFVDTSIESINAVMQIVLKLRAGSMSLEDAMESIEDAADIWESEFDETEDYD